MKKKYQEEIKRIVESLSDYRPEKVILFGSVACGKERENSDIDLLIIKESRLKRPFRVKEVFETLRNVKRQFPLDVLVYTPKEIEQRLALGDFFIKRVLAEGKVIYG
jgi:predicted nucleotidyltransferase